MPPIARLARSAPLLGGAARQPPLAPPSLGVLGHLTTHETNAPRPVTLPSRQAFGGVHFADSFEALTFTYACFNGNPPEKRATECSTARELLFRAVFYACSAPLILGFLCVLPTRRGLWTVPGYMSMYVYLLHPIILCKLSPPTIHTHRAPTGTKAHLFTLRGVRSAV